jgi:MFS family permease
MDTVGAFLGPLAAILLLFWWSENIRAVLWFAVIPAVLCVLLILFGVDEPELGKGRHAFRSPLSLSALAEFPRHYWFVLGLGTVFTLARFSEAFLVLRASQSGLPLHWIPLVMVVMSLVYSLSAYPAGLLSDRFGRQGLLVPGMVMLIVADLVLGLGGSVSSVLLGVAVWGLHMGMTQGVLAAMVAESSPAALRGTAFGLFNLVSGVAMIAASALAGWLWDRYGAPATFLTGALLATLPLAFGLYAWWRPRR